MALHHGAYYIALLLTIMTELGYIYNPYLGKKWQKEVLAELQQWWAYLLYPQWRHFIYLKDTRPY